MSSRARTLLPELEWPHVALLRIIYHHGLLLRPDLEYDAEQSPKAVAQTIPASRAYGPRPNVAATISQLGYVCGRAPPPWAPASSCSRTHSQIRASPVRSLARHNFAKRDRLLQTSRCFISCPLKPAWPGPSPKWPGSGSSLRAEHSVSMFFFVPCHFARHHWINR